jgi:hypothetical protein
VSDDPIETLASFRLGHLASALRSFAREAMLDFATGHEHGLTRAEIGLLRPVEEEKIRLLSPVKGESESRDEPKPADNHGPAPETPGKPVPRSGSVRRTARDRSPTATGSPSPPVIHETDARTDRLVILILNEDQWAGERDTHHQSTLLELDRKIGELPHLSCQVHALAVSADAAESHPRPAGQLSKRDISPSPASLDFAHSLKIIRAALDRDLVSLTPRSRPYVVFFAADPPFADPVSAEIYGALTLEASVVWVLPEQSADLLSPAFAGHGTRITTDRETAVADILRLLQVEERDPETSTVLSPSPPDTRPGEGSLGRDS